MLDMGFIDEVEDIRDACPYVRHTMLFSATMTHEVQRMIDKRIGKEYVSLHIDSESVVVDKIDHAFIDVPHISKPDMLLRWLENHKDQKVIIFTQTKIATIELQKFLYNKGFTAGQLHGDVDQRVRLSTLKAFKNNELQVMIATDVASRGLNMNDIDLVVNFDVPQDPESYVHRIGRTARAGKEGKAITFVSDGEMKSIHAIERTNKITIKKVDADGNVVDRSMERRGGGGSRGGNSRGGRFGGGRSSGGY
jgi:ATP-dependent RNA helicase DeaD